MRRKRWQRRQRDRACLTKHRQQTLERRPVACLDGSPLGPMPKVLFDNAFIEIGQL